MALEVKDHNIHIGDFICLFNEDIQGFVYNDDTSVKNNGLKVYDGQAVNDVQHIPNVHALTFQILAANRYKLSKHYKKLQKEDPVSDGALAHAKASADAELKDNESEQGRLMGHAVKYGDIIQLKHVLTNKFVLMSTKESSKTDKNAMVVNLQSVNAKQAQFRIQPRYKVKTEGELLEVEDIILLESVKSPGHYLHVSVKPHSSLNKITEINCGTDPSIFQVYRHYMPSAHLDCKIARGGSAIQLFHKDVEAYISAEGLFGEEVFENAHLRQRPLDPSKLYTYLPPKNVNTMWQIILEDSAIAGDMVKWESTFHVLHMTTRHYLSFTEHGEAVLVDQSNENTLFQFQPLLHDSDSAYVHFEQAVRLYHLKTKGWMNTSQNFKYRRADSGTEGSLEAIQWDKAKLLQLRVSSQRQYPDVFIVKAVDSETVTNLHYVEGLFPFLREIIQKANEEAFDTFSGKDIMKIQETMDELKHFVCSEDRESATCRKNMLRQTKLIDTLVDILRFPVQSNNKFMLDLYRRIYEIFHLITSAKHTANLLYFGRFLSFFQTQMLLPRNVGAQCCLTVIELIRDNRKVLDRIQPDQIYYMIDLLLEHKQHQFLDLLGALCTCNRIAITENQTLLAESMLVDNKKYLIQLEVGNDDHISDERLFLSKDNGLNWIPVERFTETDSSYSSDIIFFKKQLEFYEKLCFGGNKRCLELVTQNQGIFKWDAVMVMLKTETVPDELKTKMCSTLTAVYLESGDSKSKVDNVTNNFIYRDLQLQAGYLSSVEADFIEEQFPGLKVWLMEIFKTNPKLKESRPERNSLLSEVVYLVTSLVKYGYLHTDDDLECFKTSIMKYVKACKYQNKCTSSEEESPLENGALETIIECTDFIDVLFSLQFDRRIKHLLATFKKTVFKMESDTMCTTFCQSPLASLTSTKLKAADLWNKRSIHQSIVKLFEQLKKKSDFFKPDVLNSIFELCSLGNDTVRRKVFHLLKRSFGSIPDLVATAERAKLLISIESEQIQLECQASMPILQRLSNSKIPEDEVILVCSILQQFTGYCQQVTNEEQRKVRQDILLNNGVMHTLFNFIFHDDEMETEVAQRIYETVARNCLQLLHHLAKGNRFAQESIYDHLDDMLFRISGCGEECSNVLIQIFREQPKKSQNISAEQIRQIVQLIGTYKHNAPNWLLLLKILCKDEQLEIVNTRNQLETMKALMSDFSSVCFPMEKLEQERITILSGQCGEQLQSYYVNLISLIAACAEGKNIYIESSCQKLITVAETLRVLTSSSILLQHKIPFAQLFMRVFLNSTKSSLEIGTDELNHDQIMWQLIDIINHLTKEATAGYDKTSEPLNHHEVQFLLNAGFPIVQGFFDNLYEVDLDGYPGEQQKLIELENILEEFCGNAKEYVTNPVQLDVLSDCLQVVRSHIGTDNKSERLKEKKFVQKTIEKTREHLKTLTPTECSNYTDEEIDVNQKFKIFCSHLHTFVLGQNNVSFQCGRSQNYLAQAAYIPKDVPLTIGLDFQRFLKFFTDQSTENAKVKYKKVKEVIEQLRVSCNLWPQTVPKHQERLDIKCLEILRALIYNEVVCLPPHWDDIFVTNRKTDDTLRLLKRVKEIQNVLDSYGIIEKVFPLIGRHNPEFGRHILSMADLMMFNANIGIQSSVYKYFKSTKEETFFFFIREALEKAGPKIKDLKERTITESKKNVKKFKDSNALAVRPTHMANYADQTNTEELDIILRVLCSLCDGQNREIQNYFRWQADNWKSVDIVAKLTEFVSVVYSNVTETTIGLCTRVFNTLHEMSEGNAQNQETMLNNKIVDYINHLLRKTDFGDCTVEQVIDFRLKIAELLYSMIEEQDESGTAESVCQTVAVEYIKYAMTLCYAVCNHRLKYVTFTQGMELQELANQCSKKNVAHTKLKGTIEKLENLGFVYYVILETIFHVVNEDSKKAGFKTDLEKKAYLYFQKECKSVEVLKDEKLQRKHFRVTNEHLLREETKEVVKWGVDRTSPSSKLRDLLFYGQDILKDINYQKHMHRSPTLSWLAKNWTIWNYACVFLSLIINIFMLITWTAPFTVGDLPSNATSLYQSGTNCMSCQKPIIKYLTEAQYYIIIYVLGSVHIVCSIALFTCYIIVYHPTLPNRQYCKSLWASESDSNRQSNLEVHFLSGTTIYYLALVVFSILGTVFYGYFFAFHLFGIIENNQLLKGVIKAVTLNGRSLIWVGILGILILYIYTLIAFSSLRSSMDIEEEVFCRTLSECFVTMIRYGTVGDYGDKMHLNQMNIDFTTFGYLTLFNATFFIIFTTILLNIIFGIIVDTFSQIRDTKWVAEKDMKDCCFICGRDSHDFEHHAKGFNHHIETEHNMWAYVFYFIYLHEKEEKDYTGLDLHVAKMFEQTDIGFFPMNRALSLTKPPEYTVEDQVNDVINAVTDIQKMQQYQGKTLLSLMEKVDEMENYMKMHEVPTASDNTIDQGTSYTLEKSRKLYAQADKWRKTARLAEQNRRFSILTMATMLSDTATVGGRSVGETIDEVTDDMEEGNELVNDKGSEETDTEHKETDTVSNTSSQNEFL